MKRINEEKQRGINGGTPYSYAYNANTSIIGGNVKAPVTVVQLITNIMANINVNVNVNVGNVGPT